MPRLVIKTKKKRPPSGELSRLKEQLHRLTEQLTSRDRELAEAFDHSHAVSDGLRMIAATRTNLQAVMDAICPERPEIVRCVRRRGTAGRRQGQVMSFRTLARSMRQVQEENDEVDRASTVGRPMIDRQEEPAPQKVSAGSQHVTAHLRRSL